MMQLYASEFNWKYSPIGLLCSLIEQMPITHLE